MPPFAPAAANGIGSYPGAKGTGASVPGIGTRGIVHHGADGSGPLMMPEMFLFTFPDTLITIRNPNPSVSRRFANYALLYGYKLEMELRYFIDKEFILDDEGKEDRIYIKKLARLRRNHDDYLLEGRFLAQEGLLNGNEQVESGDF